MYIEFFGSILLWFKCHHNNFSNWIHIFIFDNFDILKFYLM